MLTAKLAHRITRHNDKRGYLARFYIYGNAGLAATFLGMGDTLGEAEADCIRYAREFLNRDRIQFPEWQNMGRVNRRCFDNANFPAIKES